MYMRLWLRTALLFKTAFSETFPILFYMYFIYIKLRLKATILRLFFLKHPPFFFMYTKLWLKTSLLFKTAFSETFHVLFPCTWGSDQGLLLLFLRHFPIWFPCTGSWSSDQGLPLFGGHICLVFRVLLGVHYTIKLCQCSLVTAVILSPVPWKKRKKCCNRHPYHPHNDYDVLICVIRWAGGPADPWIPPGGVWHACPVSTATCTQREWVWGRPVLLLRHVSLCSCSGCAALCSKVTGWL